MGREQHFDKERSKKNLPGTDLSDPVCSDRNVDGTSFNNQKPVPLGGFTGKWYVSLFQNKEIMNALYTTLIIALLSALIATLIGTLAALGMQVMRSRTRTLFMGITNIPMLNADIVTGVSLMLLFIAFRLTLGFKTILLAHITFNIPYVILSVMPKLKQTNKRTYEAALDLGASPLYAFVKVVLPDIMPGIFSGISFGIHNVTG